MSLNADKPHLWKTDIQRSVDLFNRWFMRFAPKAYRDTRVKTTIHVEESLRLSKDLTGLTTTILQNHPAILATLRMCTCPPLARDRLIGLANVSKSLVGTMEAGAIPLRMATVILNDNLNRIVNIITKMVDVDIFPWMTTKTQATDVERRRASTIVADRLCGSVSDPIVRNAQEKRQLASIGDYLKKKGYKLKSPLPGRALNEMEVGTFAFRMNVIAGDALKVKIPIDVVIQPRKHRPTRLPILVEAKSAGDFTNVNKRRRVEAAKIHQLKNSYGAEVEFILFLCGYFDSGYLGYEAAEGIDWIWEHRIEDFDQLGI